MKRIPLSQGKYALVDDADYERVSQYKWYCTNGYAVRREQRVHGGKKRIKAFRMHREIIDAPPGLDVDHINRNRLDNRRDNLRFATPTQNAINRGPQPGTSRFKGVSWFKLNNVWRAKIGINGEKVHIGCYDNEIEAAKAYDDAAHEHFGEFAYLNFPERFG